MAEILRELFLSPWLVFIVLFILFAALSYWSLVVLREYPGYGLGWLVGLFFVVVYVSLGYQPNVEGQDVNTTLNILQVFCPGILGVLLGGALIFLLRIGNSYSATRGIKIAGMTALGVVLLFLMFMVGVAAQRMIGIFALAFCIAALAGIVIVRGTSASTLFNAQGADGEEAPVDGGNFSRLDAIRARLNNQRNKLK
jgi:hypothetical protein